MKRIPYIFLFAILGLTACKKTIDVLPQSNLITSYKNAQEVRAGLNGAYNGLQKALVNEWQLTELRSDNSKQGAPGSTSSNNRDLSDLDMFIPSTSHQAIYGYWLSTYTNIRNANIVLTNLGANYDRNAGVVNFDPITIDVSEAERKQMAGEALFIRAYHYFNLVRLFGGVFLVDKPILPTEARQINRSSVAEMYKFIEADLLKAAASLSARPFSQITGNDIGRANAWAARALLAKVYLTQGKKAEAITLLQDVKANSGFGLTTTYAEAFSIANEMNREILFAVRYKSGGLGLGSLFANLFAPQGSGAAVVNGDGDGLNYPTYELDTLTNGDGRKTTILGLYNPGAKLYPRKFITAGSLNDDAENDWPILRYADVLLMLAEAQGYSQAALDNINLVRARAGLTPYTMATITSVAQFEQALSTERRIELAFENHRWFDIVRYNTTMTTLTAQQIMKDHFAKEFHNHYRLYVAPAPTLQQLQDAVTANKLLLPIPQREIDTNTSLVIPQNPGY